MGAHALIVAGGVPPKPALLLSEIKKADFVIAADSGADALVDMDVADLTLVGDFDSIAPSVLEKLNRKGITMQACDSHKDETDTLLAMDTAIKRGANTLTVLGALGKRLDHTFANVSLLLYAEKKRCRATLVDDTTTVFLAQETTCIRTKVGASVSLFSLTKRCRFISSTGLAYPLDNLLLTRAKPIGVSNEATAKNVKIKKQSGKALVMVLG